MQASTASLNWIEEQRTYPHWLDGEYFLTDQRKRDRYYSIRMTKHASDILKLRVQFGLPLAVSDQQVSDSYGVLKLFSDLIFCQFIGKHPEFLKLSPNPRYGEEVNPVRRILRRLFDNSGNRLEGFTSSLFSNPEPLLALAEILMEAGEVDPQRDLSEGKVCNLIERYRENPSTFEMLRGLVFALSHFSNKALWMDERPEVPASTMYKRLGQVLEKAGKDSGTAHYVEKLEDALRYIDTLVSDGKIDGSARGRRAVIFTQLEQDLANRNISEQQFVQRRNTMLQGWSSATQDSVSAQGGSLGYLKNSVPVEAIHRNATNVVLRLGPRVFDKSGDLPLRVHAFEAVGVNPLAASWADMHVLMTQTETSRSLFLEESSKWSSQASITQDENVTKDNPLFRAAVLHAGKIRDVQKILKIAPLHAGLTLRTAPIVLTLFSGAVTVIFGVMGVSSTPPIVSGATTSIAALFTLANLHADDLVIDTMAREAIQQLPPKRGETR